MKSSSTGSSDPSAGPDVDPAQQRRQATILLAIFGAGVGIALVVAEILLRVFVLTVEDGRAHRVQQVYRDRRPDVVLGDSHLYLPFVNSEEFVNLARAGSSPHALEIVAREYFRHVNPGRVIVEASPQLFRQLMQLRLDQGHARYFSHNFGQPFVVAVFEPGISRELAAVWDFPALLKRADVARGRRQTHGPLVDVEAERRRKLTPDERMELTRSRIQSNRPVADVTDSPGFQAYRRTLERLVARGARVCLARTPVTALYLEMSAEDPQYVQAEAALRKLAEELPLRYVDFVDLDLPLDVTSFRNPDHLTTRTGEIYAARLVRACFSPAGSPSSGSSGDSGSSP